MKYILLLFGLMAFDSYGQQFCCNKPEVAFDGYDITSYYTGEGIQYGKSDISYKYEGLNLWFENEANRSLFIENPKKYFPEYGAWCAIAMSMGALVKPNYNYYILQEDGKLLFFTIQGFINGITLWKKDSKGNKIKADAYYKTVY